MQPVAELVLRPPTHEDEDEFLRAHRATSPESPNFLHHYDDGMPFRRYLQVLAEQERGENLKPGYDVPSTFLFAFVENRIVGRVSIRHQLNDFLRRAGGHIGYVVVPEFRRRGYASRILALALRIAHDKLRIERVLLVCEDDNMASIKTIERNGGVFDGVVTVPELNKRMRQYWISGTDVAADQLSDVASP